MWDAVIILLREGMEALLVLTALLAFLNRTGHADKRKWVWSGVGTGLLLSGLMAVVLTYYISQAIAGTSRELVEGLTGLMAAVFMLAVGIWLHGKSNARTWNAYMNRQAGGALAKGSLWSLFILSGLAVLREGAETVVIYVGMAASIPMSELLLGILIAFAILAVAGFLIIRFSVRLPLRPFFLAAVVLMNYLVFRFAGESLHSLQVAGYISAHPSDKLLMVEWAGIYPTWETTLTQAVLLIYLVIQFCWAELRRS
nr:FTR1 family protein [Paenibacillus roseus]